MATVAVNRSQGSAVAGRRCEARRTQALPKRSLLGSNMEKVPNNATIDELLARIERPNTTERKKYMSSVPVATPKQLSAREDAKAAKEEYTKQRGIASRTSLNLKAAEKNTLYFEPHTSPKEDPKSPKQYPSWLTKGDVENSKDVNCLGLNERESYNHDKYGKKQDQHQYELMGDVMRPKKSPLIDQSNNSSPRQPKTVPKNVSTLANDNNNSSIPSPGRNTRNPTSQYLDTHIACDNKKCFTCTRPRLNPSIITKNLDPTYEELSNTGHGNINGGYTLYHQESLSHVSHSESVYLKRDAPTDQFRARKDKYSVWAEANLVREKLKKMWRDADLLKNEKKKGVEKPVEKPKPIKPKPKIVKKKATKPSKQEPDDDILADLVFETPPSSPVVDTEPIPPPLDNQTEDVEKDDAFWQFYNKPVPMTNN